MTLHAQTSARRLLGLFSGAAALAILATAPALADAGGTGGNFTYPGLTGTGGAGGNGSATGTGGVGSAGAGSGSGGGGGGAGITGGAGGAAALYSGNPGGTGGAGGATAGAAGSNGVDGTDAGGGGGGGGAHGAVITTITTTAATVSGGAGGNGGASFGNLFGGGGGGEGGYAYVINGAVGLTSSGVLTGGAGGKGADGADAGGGGYGGDGGFGVSNAVSGASLINSGTITGGNAGAGGAAAGLLGTYAAAAGNGGNGGAGIAGSAFTITNTGTITGGNGGTAGIGSGGSTSGANGLGGVGITGTGLTVIDSGAISGGLAGDGTTRANAITFTGTGNSLELQTGYSFGGNVVGGGSDTLKLGGSAGGNFALSAIGTTFTGFTGFQKTGTGQWTLTGTSATAWTVNQGTLGVSGTIGAATVNQGTLIVSGTVGAATVNQGTLNVVGTAGAVSVSGGSLTGTGTVASINATGGSVTPGNPAGTGKLTATGNISLGSAVTTVVALTPAANTSLAAGGTASIGGTLNVAAASGTYTYNSSYTIVKATGGLSGTFSGLQVTGLPNNLFRPRLSYDANDAYLVLAPNALTPLLGGVGTTNEFAVAAAIDNAVQNHNVNPTGGFLALYNLSGAALGAALDQISGQLGPNISNAVAGDFTPFLDMMLSQNSGTDNSSMTIASNDGVGSAYDAPKPAQAEAGAMRLWGGLYGGHTGYAADLISGGAALSANGGGIVVGVDTALDSDTTIGGSLALGRQNFRSGNGTGNSTDVMVGLYGNMKVLDAGYVAASLGVGRHDIKTSRVITVAGTDVLNAKFLARQFGGRVEAGYHVALDSEHELTPFAALVGEDFQAPAYGETLGSGAATFALTYNSHNSGIGHGELGARFGHSYVSGDETFSAVATAALAHAFDNAPFIQSSFNAMPNSGFVLRGVHVAPDTALLGLDLGMKDGNALSYGLQVRAQVGSGTTIVQEMATLGLQL